MTASRTLLFVDDHDILYRSGTARRLRPLDRCPQNPVLPAREKPWEINIGWVGNAYNPANGLYQLWYQAFTGTFAQQRTHRCLVCYAESTDGIHWTKPNLDLFDYNGGLPTNIVMIGNGGYSDRYTNSVLLDWRDPDPARRYKMATCDFSMDAGIERPGLVVAFSPDGIHWTKHPQAPLVRTSYGGHELPPFTGEPGREGHIPLTISDAMDVIYDPKSAAYVIYSKMWIDGPDGRMHWKHAMGRTESRDFVRWSKPELVLAPDELDPPWVEFHDITFKTGVGMASMPRDRFAALYPQGEAGQVTLRPLDMTGCRGLTLNADARAGRVEVEVLNADGYRVRGFAREDAVPITGDGLRLPVSWRERPLADLPAGNYCLRVFLQNAELYAATFSNEPA